MASVPINRAVRLPWRNALSALRSPLAVAVPARLADRLAMLQAERVATVIPVLCLTVIANSAAMTLAVAGDLPLWQQALPPTIIIVGALIAFAAWRRQGAPATPAAARRQLSTTVQLTVAQGLVAGFWCVNAFIETEKYYCMTAPVFIGIAALVNASCLVSVPRAAVAGIAATLLPIVVKMALYDNAGVRAMAAMLVVIGLTQSGLVLAKFREMVSALVLQDELNHLALTDPLTGLSNRRAFYQALDANLTDRRPVLVAIADLNGFKAANDTHGHHAGDDVLVGVARRLQQLAVSAAVVARLGGDEFALLYIPHDGGEQARTELDAIRAAIALPFAVGAEHVSVSTCIGVAHGPGDAQDAGALMHVADQRLYAEKRTRKAHDRAPVAA